VALQERRCGALDLRADRAAAVAVSRGFPSVWAPAWKTAQAGVRNTLPKPSMRSVPVAPGRLAPLAVARYSSHAHTRHAS
jgi:hypothetical protein